MKFLRANAPRLPLDQIAAFAAEHFGLTGELTPLYSERDQNVRLREKNGSAWVLKTASAEESNTVRADASATTADPSTERRPCCSICRQAAAWRWVSSVGRTSMVLSSWPGHYAGCAIRERRSGRQSLWR